MSNNNEETRENDKIVMDELYSPAGVGDRWEGPRRLAMDALMRRLTRKMVTGQKYEFCLSEIDGSQFADPPYRILRAEATPMGAETDEAEAFGGTRVRIDATPDGAIAECEGTATEILSILAINCAAVLDKLADDMPISALREPVRSALLGSFLAALKTANEEYCKSK